MKKFSALRRAVSALSTVLLFAIASWVSEARANPASAYSIDFHTISAGGTILNGNCIRLQGTVGQAAPGYSSGHTESIFAGFWAAALASGTDEIFFNGFEGCSI
jgi:hypothetical protein